MEMNQVYQAVNGMTKEILGESAVVAEDLSNIVDIGKAVFDNASYDKVVKSLVDHIGKVVFVDRKYTGFMAPLYREAWEYGAVKEKITNLDLPEATENESWELTDGASYDPNVYTKSKVSAKFFDKRTTLEVPLSIVDRQMRTAFSNAQQLNSFTSMLFTNIDNTLTVKGDALGQRTINNMIAETLYAEFPSVSGNNYDSSTGVKAINLLKLFNTQFSQSETKDGCIFNAEFIRFACFYIKRYMARLRGMSTLHNIGGLPRFTPSDKLEVALISDLKDAADIYLQSETFNDEYTKLPLATSIPYWQGTGTDYAFGNIGKINVSILDTAGSAHSIEASNILGVMFDRDACGISNLDKRTTSNYNGKAEFTNFWYKVDCAYWNDLNEQFVVFFAA